MRTGAAAEQARQIIPLADDEFKKELTNVIPHLRAFARSLSGSRDLADDLVQDTLLKAWSARKSFQAGTNIRAWTFIILRNLFLSEKRRSRFKGEWNEMTAAQILVAPADQQHHVHLADVQRGLMMLPALQREALILVGAGGLPYEEVAEICGVAVGTIKSRVARARSALEDILSNGALPARRRDSGSAVIEIMQYLQTLTNASSNQREAAHGVRIGSSHGRLAA